MRPPDHDLNDPIAWGRRLITTRDIDPVYDMLVGADLPRDQLARWLVAYWAFYNSGVASALSEDTENFWIGMDMAAANLRCPYTTDQRWPRSTERRHFRGAKCVKSVHYMTEKWPRPERLVEWLAHETDNAVQAISKVMTIPMFGPWIGFKVADMLERVWGQNMWFPPEIVFYDSPRKGRDEIAALLGIETAQASAKVLIGIGQLRPPGLQTRNCSVTELETILCKWHSARGGHYFIGKDLLEVRHSLSGWGETADRLAKSLPPPLSETP